MIIETFRFLSQNAATDETFERSQRSVVFRRNKTYRIADGVRATGASDAMNIILRVHWEIVVHHMRDPIHVDATGGDVRRHQDTHRAGFEILQRAQPLVLRAIGMDRARSDSAAFKTARKLIGAALGPDEHQNRVEFRIA